MSTYGHWISTASTSSTTWYDTAVKKEAREFDQKLFNKFEKTIEKHRQKKSQEVKKEYLFNPDDLDL
jgi:hypothetical protein